MIWLRRRLYIANRHYIRQRFTLKASSDTRKQMSSPDYKHEQLDSEMQYRLTTSSSLSRSHCSLTLLVDLLLVVLSWALATSSMASPHRPLTGVMVPELHPMVDHQSCSQHKDRYQQQLDLILEQQRIQNKSRSDDIS